MGEAAVEPYAPCHQGMHINDGAGGFCINEFAVTNAEYENSVVGQRGMSLFGLFVKGYDNFVREPECEDEEDEYEACLKTDTGPTILVDHQDDPVAMARRYRSLLDGERVCEIKVKPLLATDLRGVPEELSSPNHPAVNVSWEQASEYCEATGGRLPTIEESELAHATYYCWNQFGFSCLYKVLDYKSTYDLAWGLDHSSEWALDYSPEETQELQETQERQDNVAVYNEREGNVETTFHCVYPPRKWHRK